MAIKKTIARRGIVLAALCGIVFGTAALEAQERRAGRQEPRFAISAGGGMGRSEGHQAVMEMKLGLLYRVASSIRIGLAFGYLKPEGHHGMDGSDRYSGRSTMMDGMDWGVERDGAFPDFRIKSASVELAYALPVGRRWDVTIGAGGGRYFGEFAGPREDVHRRAWGGQGGLGAEFRIASKLTAFAEAGYRFLEFRDIPAADRTVPVRMMGIDERYRPVAEWIARGLEMWMPSLAPRPVDLRLDGPTFRLGLRFGI